jgi:uncharacterized membrane protein YhaH (DUF805 family)
MNMQKPEANYNMIDWFKKVLIHNYANFNGRARRSEYWWFRLATLLITMVPYLLFSLFFANIPGPDDITPVDNYTSTLPFMVFTTVWLALLIPTMAVAVRRLHDTNKSGWFILLFIIPFGAIFLLVFYFQEGNRYTNDYGPDPKAIQKPQFDFEEQQQEVPNSI